MKTDVTKRNVLICFLLTVSLMLSFISGCSPTPPNAETQDPAESESQKETEKESESDIEVSAEKLSVWQYKEFDHDFYDDKVIVVIFPEYFNEEYSLEDFAYVGCTNLYEHECAEGSLVRRFTLTLDKKSKENVLEVVDS